MAKKPARSFIIKRATREAMKVYLGVAGPSSSGKTYTALRLGTGIQTVVGGALGLIDTENSRALMYADDFKFEYIPFDPPFNALSYFDALKFAASKGVKTLIVDSMSHEHEGEGGHLWMHEAELTRIAGDDWKKRDRVKFLAWAKPAAERRELLLALQRSPMNLILCFRAKDKLALVKKDGKTEPVSIGWQPIAGPEYVFDMTALVVLPPRSGGVPDWQAEAAKVAKGWGPLFIQGKPLDEATGERLARYATGEKVKPVGQEIAPLTQDARRQTSGDDAGGGDVPQWAPEGGWPEFKTVSDWVKWSTKFLTTADRDQANAWSQWWSRYSITLADLVRDNKRGAAEADKELKAALAGAMKREGRLL